MDAVTREVAATRLLVDRGTAAALEALRAYDVPAILLKGPSFDRLRPAGAGRRYYTDTDLIVPPHALPAAERALEAAGYVRALAREDLPGPRPHALPWQRGTEPMVDLHTTLPGVGTPDAALWTDLSRDADTIEVAGVTAPILAPDALALHAALHALHCGPDRTRPLEDLEAALAATGEDTWKRAAERARRLDAEADFVIGLGLTEKGRELAERLGVSPERSSRRARMAAATPRAGALGFDDLITERGPVARLRFVARKLVPTPRYMRTWSRLAARGPAGLALAYVWRPVWVLLQLRRAIAAWLRAGRGAV